MSYKTEKTMMNDTDESESIEVVDLATDIDNEDKFNQYSLRDRNKRNRPFYYISSQDSCSDDFDYEQSVSNSFANDDINWSENESIRLIYIVNRVGKRWRMIANEYKAYLKNKDDSYLLYKYSYLKKNKKLFEELRRKSEKVKDVEILNFEFDKKSPVRWSSKELTYLVLGVMKYGKKWTHCYNIYKPYFDESRSRTDLTKKYNYLKNNRKMFAHFKQKAELLAKKQN
jgi:hypothetical protein